jgi:hypothetical protein
VRRSVVDAPRALSPALRPDRHGRRRVPRGLRLAEGGIRAPRPDGADQ